MKHDQRSGLQDEYHQIDKPAESLALNNRQKSLLSLNVDQEGLKVQFSS